MALVFLNLLSCKHRNLSGVQFDLYALLHYFNLMKAIVIGSTGLVGRHIVQKLLNLDSVSEVQVFARRSLNQSHPKLTEEIVDFERISEWQDKINGDILYSAFGTTLRAAHSKEKQFHIDHDYQLNVAKAAMQNGVKAFVLISTVNANPDSSFFYLRMKGQIEEEVKKLPFLSISILRPGPLTGTREKPRFSEIFSTTILDLLSKLVKLKIEPVDSSVVADVAVQAGIKSEKGMRIISPQEILAFGKK